MCPTPGRATTGNAKPLLTVMAIALINRQQLIEVVDP
jgi:hypothetical protein